MQDVSIIETDTDIRLVSPYHPDLPKRAHSIGGKWDAATRSWRFDLRDLERVRRLAADLWGWSDGSDADVTIRVNADDYDEGRSIRVAGRQVAWRPARDEPVWLANNVIVVSGEFADSGGSINNPAIGACDDVVLEIRDLPSGVLDLLKKGRYEVVDGDEATALEQERARLTARIAAIDERLARLKEHR